MDKKHVPPGLVGNVAAFLVQQFRQSGQHFQIGRRSDVVMPFHFLAILLQQEMVKRRLPQKQVSQEQVTRTSATRTSVTRTSVTRTSVTRTIATRTCHKISIVKSNVLTTTTTTTVTYLGHGGDAGLHVHTNVHHTLAFLVVEFHVLEGFETPHIEKKTSI
jgi:hypothetical protein